MRGPAVRKHSPPHSSHFPQPAADQAFLAFDGRRALVPVGEGLFVFLFLAWRSRHTFASSLALPAQPPLPLTRPALIPPSPSVGPFFLPVPLLRLYLLRRLRIGLRASAPPSKAPPAAPPGDFAGPPTGAGLWAHGRTFRPPRPPPPPPPPPRDWVGGRLGRSAVSPFSPRARARARA